MKKSFLILVLSTLILGCNKDEIEQQEPTIFELLEGKWQLVSLESYTQTGLEFIEPEYNGIINIVIKDTIIKEIFNYSEDDKENGLIEYFESDRYGNEPLEYSFSSINLFNIPESDYDNLDLENISFRKFSLNTNHYYWPRHYIKMITDERLILTVSAFPYWPDLIYERINE